jgi:glyoxylase-like metal-dependent hydrolase (beta-lactamase superfamily II)
MSPRVQPFFHPDTHTWTYLVWDPDTKVAAIVDPVLDFDPISGRSATDSVAQVLAAARDAGVRLQWILETHAHADHLSAAQWLRTHQPGSRIAIGAGIRQVQERFANVFNFESEFQRDGSQFDHLFADDEEFGLGSIPAHAIPTPGHTGDSLSYLIGDALFTGDSLFLPDSGTARCDFPGGDAAILFASIQRLYSLPEATRVFVCHDYMPGGREPRCETTIGEQKRANIHVREGVSQASYVRLREERDATLGMPRLILPAVQVNIRAGAFPPAEGNGTCYLKLPLDRL